MLLSTSCLLLCSTLLVSGLPVQAQAAKNQAAGRQFLVYVGTYTGLKSKGIYAYRLDTTTGALAPLGLAAETVNPTFLAISPDGRCLYAANETGSFAGKKSGAVSAFTIDRESGKLSLLNQVASGGGGPCHLLVDPSGKCVVVANYGGGSTAALPVQADGRLGEATSFIQHAGSSVNPQRQEGPHAHGIALDAANQRAFVADLGLDKILIYRFDAAKAVLTAGDPPWTLVKAGAGPRHFTLHPNGRYAYVINELDSTVTAFNYDGAQGQLRELQTVSTLPTPFTGNNSTAELEVHPNGKFLYGSNRGHNSIAVFALDPSRGTLTPVEHQPTRGKTPRNFALDPTGAGLLAANQDTDNIVQFRLDPKTGKLSPTGQVLEVGAPVCIKFVAVP